MSFKIYPDSITEEHSNNLFRYVLKVCNFYKPNCFKDYEYYPNQWIDKNFVSSMIALRKSKALFSSIYDTIQLSNQLQKIPFENNFEDIASDFLKINKENLSLRGIQFRMDFPNDSRNSYGWHQDNAYDRYNLRSNNGAVLWIPLIGTNKKNGTLIIKVGSQYSTFNCSEKIKKTSKYTSEQIIVKKNFLKKYKSKSVNVKKNSALTTYCGIFHKSGVNTSEQIRFTIVVRYNNQFSKDFLYYRNLINKQAV